MEKHLNRLKELRTQSFELQNPTPVEKELKAFLEYMYIKRSERPRGISSVMMSDKVIKLIGKNRLSSKSYFMTLALREMDKRKCNDKQHHDKCNTALVYVQKARLLPYIATENEKILFERIEEMVSILIAVQCPPGDY